MKPSCIAIVCAFVLALLWQEEAWAFIQHSPLALRQHSRSSHSSLCDFRRPKPKNNKGGRSGGGGKPSSNASRGNAKRESRPRQRGKGDVEDSESPPFGLKSSTVAVVNQPVVNTKTAATGTKTKSTNILGQNVVRCRDFSVNSAKTADFIGSYPSMDQMPIFSIPELAFLGRSNVGKSSLFNCLIGAKVAVCSKTPGRTQSLNTFTCKDKDGEIAVMVDLPGYGYAKLSKEKQDDISRFIENYLRERRSLRLVVLLVDCRREVQEYEAGVLRFLRDEGLQYILVATKIDKMGKNEAATAMGKYRRELQLEQDQLVGFSSLTSQGRKELWGKIRDGMIGTVSAAFAEEEKEGEGGVDGSGETLLEYDDDEVGWS